jgi:hypothetical protein
MISEVLKEVSVFLETRVEPGEPGLGELGVGCYALVFDVKSGSVFRLTSTVRI